MKKEKKNKIIEVTKEIDVELKDVPTETTLDQAEERTQELIVEEDQQSFSSKVAQTQHIKNIKKSLQQEALIEKQKIEEERARLKATILEIEAEIEKAKLRQTKIIEDAKFQEAMIVEEAKKKKEIEAIELKNRQELLKQRQKDIQLVEQSFQKKQTLIKEEIAAKKADIDQKLHLGKVQIREELAAKRREAKIKDEEQRQLALELRQQLKEERLKAHEEKLLQRSRFKQEIAQMRLELYAEKQRQKQELESRKLAARNERMKEVEVVKQEADKLKENKKSLQGELKISKIRTRLRIMSQKAKIDLELAEHRMDAELVKEENQFAIKSAREVNAHEIERYVRENDALNQTSSLDVLNRSKGEERDAEAIKIFKEDYVTLVSDFKNFERVGRILLEKAKKPISEKKLQKYKNHPYYGPMVNQYIQLESEGNFANLYTMILASLVISEDELNYELVEEKTKTLQMAILQGIPIKVGPYYVMPIKRSGINSYYISHHLKDGEVIFDNNKLFSAATLKALEEIISYKLEFGTSIKILDGLAIANVNGELTVATYPNVIK